jgi:hypothetical protein
MPSVKIFKIKNRRGYAALCAGRLTEGKTPEEARARMEKALKRKNKKNSNIQHHYQNTGKKVYRPQCQDHRR